MYLSLDARCSDVTAQRDMAGHSLTYRTFSGNAIFWWRLNCLHPFSCRLTFRSVNRRIVSDAANPTPCERTRAQANIYCCANNFDPFASISSRQLSFTAMTHCTFIRLLPTPTPAARTATAQVTILRNLTETVGSHSGEHEHATLWDVPPCSFDKHVSEEPTLPAQERECASANGTSISARLNRLTLQKAVIHSRKCISSQTEVPGSFPGIRLLSLSVLPKMSTL